MERIQKVIAASGLTSRRKAEEWIKEGRVSVNGQIIQELGYKVKKGDQIAVDGNPINKENKVYYLINKPKKTLCTLHDEHGRNMVTDLIDCKERIYPVGRLDYDTTGLLICTNDGDFANCLVHPRYHIPKTYDGVLDGILTTEQIKRIEKGIVLDDGIKTLPCKLTVTSKNFERHMMNFTIVIKEGRNRQIKRMMETFGLQVVKLHRRKLGFLTVNDLKVGEYRLLKPYEVKRLRRLAEEGKEK